MKIKPYGHPVLVGTLSPGDVFIFVGAPAPCLITGQPTEEGTVTVVYLL